MTLLSAVKINLLSVSINQVFSRNLIKGKSECRQLPYLNQKGFMVLAPLFASLIFSLGILLIYKSLKENLRIKERSQVLLCLKEYEVSKRSYIQKMSALNKVISAAFALRAIPPLTIYAQKLQEAAKKIQQIYHIAHLKNPFSFKFCSSLIFTNYLKTLPYKTLKGVTLSRRLDGSCPLKKDKWSELIWSDKRNIFFILRFNLKGRFTSTPIIRRREYSKAALLSLKEFSGSHLFSLSQ